MKKFLLYAILAIILFVSCDTTKEMIPCDNDSEAPIVVSGKNRTLPEAVAIAESGLRRFDTDKTTRGAVRQVDFSNIRYKIDQTTRSGEPDTLLYILNFTNDNGFALIAANRDAEGLIAIAEDGSYDGTTTGNIGFDMYMEDTYRYLSSEVVASPVIGNDVLIERKRVGPVVTAHAKVDEMTTVNWGQDAPFNLFCSNPYNMNVPSGCVATAIATAMSAYSYPTAIHLTYLFPDRTIMKLDWDRLKGHDWKWCQILNNCSTCETCCQIGYLSREIGHKVDMVYKVGGSSANTSTKAAPCLRSFGYTTGDYRNSYNNSTVCNSMANGGIVIVRGENSKGEGHAWVIDGYEYTKTREEYYTRPKTIPESNWTLDTFLEKSLWYVHFNYGWEGINNVWVLSAAYDYGKGSQLYTGVVDEWTYTVFTDKQGCNKDIGILPNIKPNR